MVFYTSVYHCLPVWQFSSSVWASDSSSIVSKFLLACGVSSQQPSNAMYGKLITIIGKNGRGLSPSDLSPHGWQFFYFMEMWSKWKAHREEIIAFWEPQSPKWILLGLARWGIHFSNSFENFCCALFLSLFLKRLSFPRLNGFRGWGAGVWAGHLGKAWGCWGVLLMQSAAAYSSGWKGFPQIAWDAYPPEPPLPGHSLEVESGQVFPAGSETRRPRDWFHHLTPEDLHTGVKRTPLKSVIIHTSW